MDKRTGYPFDRSAAHTVPSWTIQNPFKRSLGRKRHFALEDRGEKLITRSEACDTGSLRGARVVTRQATQDRAEGRLVLVRTGSSPKL